MLKSIGYREISMSTLQAAIALIKSLYPKKPKGEKQ